MVHLIHAMRGVRRIHSVQASSENMKRPKTPDFMRKKRHTRECLTLEIAGVKCLLTGVALACDATFFSTPKGLSHLAVPPPSPYHNSATAP